ncbi:MAG: ABC transporter ATP-binding protein [Myxococcota bacterium]
MSDPMLRASGVAKSFRGPHGELDVLRGIDLQVCAGESIAILGVSGAGKSTLLHLLGGLEQPSAGRVEVDGRSLYDMPPEERARFRNGNLGFVFQFHHLLPEFSALENVMMPGLLAGQPMRGARSQARALLAGVGLEGRLDHRPGKLSGGERQRVAIARALYRQPRLILADEPTGNLDTLSAEAIESVLLDRVSQAGSALILVTHNEKLASRLAKKAYLVDGGLES